MTWTKDDTDRLLACAPDPDPSKEAPGCPVCGELGRPIGVYQWLLGWSPYTDSEGVEHHHDPNRRCEHWVCANGHSWEGEQWFEPCPACGACKEVEWNGKLVGRRKK